MGPEFIRQDIVYDGNIKSMFFNEFSGLLESGSSFDQKETRKNACELLDKAKIVLEERYRG
jgi:hypothetical protein